MSCSAKRNEARVQKQRDCKTEVILWNQVKLLQHKIWYFDKKFNKKPNLSGIKRQTKWSVRCCGECAYIVHITISVSVLFHRDTISGIQTQDFFSEFHFFIATEYLVSPLMNSCLHIFNYTCITDIILHKGSVY